MGAPIKTIVGQKYNAWEVIEANIINPNTTAAMYIGKPVFSKCLCTKCNKTERYFRNNELKRASQQCNNCATIERNIKNREVQIGKIYGYLEVVGDGGYQYQGDKRRHYSICNCLLCGKTNILKKDNQLQTGNTVSCGCLCSLGEQKIKDILNENHINFDHNISFKPLNDEANMKLRFDFIIYDENRNPIRFIEFDGEQHKENWHGGNWSQMEDFEIRHNRDIIKNNFCIKYNYDLVRIPYKKLKTLCLEDILGNEYLIKGGDYSDKK